jgi:hypothetical protein
MNTNRSDTRVTAARQRRTKCKERKEEENRKETSVATATTAQSALWQDRLSKDCWLCCRT